MSYLLRHAPHAAALTMDPYGWVSVPQLLSALGVDRATLDVVVAGNDKRRFEVRSGAPGGVAEIRAAQGHSVRVDLALPPVSPPSVLYHGTQEVNLPSIRDKGLVAGRRQHVHLSPDVVTASSVAGRRAGRAVVLTVAARRMSDDGHRFYRSTNGVWLADAVPAAYLDVFRSADPRPAEPRPAEPRPAELG